MCNLYSLTKGQAAIRDWFRAKYDRTGNQPLFPGIFPDQFAPIVRNGVDGERELVMARWGMPGPPQFGGQPVTNIRNVSSPHWRGWLSARNRCLVPATSFCEYAPTTPRKTPTGLRSAKTGRCSPSRASGRGGGARKSAEVVTMKMREQDGRYRFRIDAETAHRDDHRRS